MPYQLAGSAAAGMPAGTKALEHAAGGKHQSSPPYWLQQAALLRPAQSKISTLHSGLDCSWHHGSPLYRQPQAVPRPLPSSLLAVRCSIKGSTTSSSPYCRPSAAPALRSWPSALPAGHSVPQGSHIARRLRQAACRARRMSSEEACALLGIRGSCSREELRAAYLSLIKEV